MPRGGQQRPGERPPLQARPFRSDTIMLVRAGARHLAQALDPPRHARRDPRPGAAEDQLGLRLRRRQARRSGRSRACSASTSTRSRSSTSTASAASSTRSAGSTSTCRPTSARASRRAPSTSTSSRARTTSTASRRSRSRAPARTRCGEGEFAGTDVERAQFQQLILDGIKGKLTSITSLPMNFIQGPVHRLERPEGDGLEHGRADHAPARDRGGDRRRRRHRRARRPRARRPPATSSISPEECERAAEKLLGGKPPREPNCPQS